jgi:hypothetical protein
MFLTIDKVNKILESDLTDKKFEYIESKEIGYGYSRYLDGDSWRDYFDKDFRRKDVAYDINRNEKNEICYGCLNIFDKNAMIEIDDSKFCGDCYSKMFTTCTCCGDVFKDLSKTHLLCEKCRGDKGNGKDKEL